MSDENLPVPATMTQVPAQTGAMQPMAPIYELEDAFRQYQEVSRRLLDASDYQQINNRSFMKKSGFRKLAVAYGVTVELVERVYDRDDNGRIIRAEVMARAHAPNGRAMDGLGACDILEKCCIAAECKNRSQYHSHCAPDCSGVKHFSNPSHDLPATAATRATNRACSDLFGMGEVSAEEVVNVHSYEDAAPTPSQALMARISELGEDELERLRAYCAAHVIPTSTRDMTEPQRAVVDQWIDDNS